MATLNHAEHSCRECIPATAGEYCEMLSLSLHLGQGFGKLLERHYKQGRVLNVCLFLVTKRLETLAVSAKHSVSAQKHELS